MGAEAFIQDIDTAHRMNPRNASNRPDPSIFKFTRQRAREEVMSRRTGIFKVAPQDAGLLETSNLTNAMFVDHLTPQSLSKCSMNSGTAGPRAVRFVSEGSRSITIKGTMSAGGHAQ